MKYLQSFSTKDLYTSAKTAFEYPCVAAVDSEEKAYFMGSPYWKVVFSVTADQIDGSTIVPIYEAYRATVDSVYESANKLVN